MFSPLVIKLEISQVKNVVLNFLPDLLVSSIKYLGEGDFCRAYLVNGEWIFRFAKHEAARLSLRREFCLLPKIAGHITLSIPSPQFGSFEIDKKTPFIAYPLLGGSALTRNEYLKLNEAERDFCTKQIASFLNELHSTGIECALDCGVKTNNYVDQYSGLLTEARENLFTVLARSECEFVERVIENYLQSGAANDFSPVLLHGDLSPNHIIYNEKSAEISAVIDFGDMVIGDPAWDFLWIYEDYGSDFLSRLLPAYHAADKISLLPRIRQFSQLQAIEWANDCLTNDSDELPKALRQLKAMSVKEED